ncbi:hypothetical protein OG581_12315 [Streptomyces sp. NBC_01386]|uniref:hypothetical protein n=1 Tax=Streptomyces sp. NBC_01386 TaxID=2903848 RepID=UPI0032535A6B
MSGRVKVPGFHVEIDARDVTPDVLSEPGLDGGETSISRYVQAHAAGDDRLVALPTFVKRGFRHRCVLVRADSPLRSFDQLACARIDLTGWPDSGNTWTRALIRAGGVDLSGIEWRVGPLAAGAVGTERLSNRPLPPNVSAMAEGESLARELAAGRLDAILTSFMPPEFFTPESRFRHLLDDHPAAERAYWAATGFVPGIHLVTLKRDVVEVHPELPAVLLAGLEASKRHWLGRRRLLADTPRPGCCTPSPSRPKSSARTGCRTTVTGRHALGSSGLRRRDRVGSVNGGQAGVPVGLITTHSASGGPGRHLPHALGRRPRRTRRKGSPPAHS